MLSNHRHLLPAFLATGAFTAIALGQPYTFQRTNSIDLAPFFFGGGTSQFGVNPISVAFDGSTAWVGGYQNAPGVGTVGVVRIGSPLSATPSAAGLTGTGASSAASQFRGFTQLAALNDELYIGYDVNPPEGTTPFIRKINGTTGDQLWQVTNPFFGARPFAMAIDPRGGATNDGTLGVPGLGVMSQDPFVSGGARFTLRLTDGAAVYGPGSVVGQGGAGVFQTAGQTIGFSNRDIAFDDNGNFLLSTGQGHAVATRAGNNSFVQFNVPTPGAGSTGVLRKNENVLNGEGIAGVFIPTRAADPNSGTATLMAVSMRVPSGDTLTYTQQDNTTQAPVSARHVHIRNLHGSLTGNPQAALTGAEDFFTGEYSGQVKDLAVGRDANGNPVLMVLSFSDRRLDIYQVEPTFTAAGGDWDTASNWNLSLIASGATQNARFTGAGGTVTLNSARTTKLLKLGGSGSYTITGNGTLTTQAPDGKGAHIAVLAGNHTVAVPVVAASGTDLRVPAGRTLSLPGGITGSGVSKRDDGLAQAKHVRVSALAVREGTLRISPSINPNDGVSRTADLTIQTDTGGAFLATLDLTNNGLIVTTTPQSAVRDAVLSGRAGGNWTGTGLTSSTAAANSAVTAVGLATAGELGLTTFLGQTVAATDTLVRYTRLGDANLNGTTELGDFSLLASNFNAAGGWSRGDFDFDGQVGLGDFSLLAANFNLTAPADLPRTTVPEPAAVGLLPLVLTALARVRRR
ncbi:MAG: hypothetical protein NZ561_01205 [Phycisphaerae bacterium]|nr:hypothetical protein [Phycisphaerae bacterium]MDW8262051.1 hypothetical protein [Phycisphaerales bacterium]